MTPQHLAKTSTHINRVRIVFSWLAGIAIVSCLVSLVIAVAMLLGDQADLQPILTEGSDPFLPPGILPFLFAGSQMAALGLLGFAAFFWINRLAGSCSLARKAGARDMRYSGLMAAVWHFVPVMGYVMPMLVMVELESATRSPHDWQDARPSRLAGTTWLIAKLSAMTFSATLGLDAGAATAEQYVRALELTSFAMLFVIGGLLLAIWFAARMRMLQIRLLASSTSGLVP